MTQEELNSDQWRVIKNFPRYLISRSGQVFSIGKGIKRPFKNDKGYLVMQLWSGNKPTGISVHRLVALAFVENPENKPEVNHEDGNKLNNNDWNLSWMTRTEQMRHAIRTGLYNKKKILQPHLPGAGGK